MLTRRHAQLAFGDPEPDLTGAWCARRHCTRFHHAPPPRLRSKIGESGLALSAERTALAISRAVYFYPPILVFDEATSALDTESERAIQDNLTRMMSGRTCIVIAHRLSTIRDADMIVVLEKGEVAETGTHDELMARRGLYFHLSSQQLGSKPMTQTPQSPPRLASKKKPSCCRRNPRP